MTDTSFLAAAVQFRPAFMDPAANRERSAAFVRDAAAQGARLVVLPEASNAGYMFADREEARTWAEHVTEGGVTSAWAALAAELGIWLCAGFIEAEEDRVYNAMALYGPDGHAATFRKVHLWNDEKRIFDAGDLGFPVADTPLGRFGFAICYDIWFPETMRASALAGADLICVPANWVPVPGQPDDVPLLANQLCMTGAHVNQVYLVGADRIGEERGQPFLGRSVICDHTGWPLAGPASPDREEILIARVDPIGSRAERAGNPFNQPLADRRPGAYGQSAVEAAPA